MIGVYKFTNKYNRKVYVGKSIHIERRYKEHLKAAKLDSDLYFSRALRKYGEEGFDFDVLIELPWLEGLDKDTVSKVLNYWETFYIKYYSSNNPNFGYNMTEGGGGNIIDWTDDMRKHQSETMIKYYEDNPMTDEHKSNLSVSLTGYKQTEEHRNNISKALSGRCIHYPTEEEIERHTEFMHKYIEENGTAMFAHEWTDESIQKMKDSCVKRGNSWRINPETNKREWYFK